MDAASLNYNFAIPEILRFEEANGLVRAEITTPAATATVYLQGAHITHWQPADQAPVLFLSRKTDLVPGKPIRGGVPISFPWFAVDTNPNRRNGKPGPSHGFARIQPWTLAFAALSGDDLHLTFTLGPTQESRDLGFDHFRLAYQITVGQSLLLQLTVANNADVPLVFEEALHTYFAVSDVSKVSVTGLEAGPFLDKIDGSQRPAANTPLTFAGSTDRVYADTGETCVIHDHPARRRITNIKTNSQTTVIFNPWREMPDLGSDEWQGMLCLETANAGRNAITLSPKTAYTMQAKITVGGIEA